MDTSSFTPDEELRYPVGRYHPTASITGKERATWIAEIEALPRKLRDAVSGLKDKQLDTPYRPGGWTVRQVVHHVPDSHMNSYSRFRFALTEHSPTVKPYDEAAWAELIDAKSAPIEPSLALLEGLHARWVILLRSMSDTDFARTLKHAELGEPRLDWVLGQYAWHCRHHVAHITNLRKRERW
jgi:DinB superfamily